MLHNRVQQHKLIALAPWLLGLAAVLVLLWVLPRLFWLLFSPDDFNYQPLAGRQQAVPAEVSLRANWFGNSVVAPEVAQTLEDTRLDARLLGVLMLGEHAVANIVVGKDNKKIYREGDAIQRGVILAAIEPRRVVLREHGVMRQLLLQRADANSSGDDNDDQPLIELAVPSITPSTPSAPGQRQLSDTATDLVALSGLDDARLAQLGLQAQDQVLAADGVPLNEIMSNPETLKRLLSQPQINVTVLRDGQEHQLSVDAATIARQMMSGGVGVQ